MGNDVKRLMATADVAHHDWPLSVGPGVTRHPLVN